MVKHIKEKSVLRFSRHHYWFFFVAFVISGLIGLYGLRQNNLTSVRLREELLMVDKNDGDVESALRKLREHIYSHMNASLSNEGGLQHPVQLKYRFERLVEAENAKVSDANSKIYSDAQAICERQFPQGLSGSGRIPCIQDFVAKNGVQEQNISDALYKFDFISPAWSLDMAGLGLLGSMVFLLLFLVGLYFDRRYRHSMRH